MTMRIGICGTQCSGKSTLAKYIAAEKNLPLIADIAGDFKSRDTSLSQINIMHSQIGKENLYGDRFVTDRTVLDNIAYQMYLDPEIVLNGTEHDVGRHMINHPYDLIVFVNEYFKLIPSEHRSMDERQQKWVFHYLRGSINYFTNLFDIPLCTVNGSTQHRYNIIQEFLEYEYD